MLPNLRYFLTPSFHLTSVPFEKHWPFFWDSSLDSPPTWLFTCYQFLLPAPPFLPKLLRSPGHESPLQDSLLCFIVLCSFHGSPPPSAIQAIPMTWRVILRVCSGSRIYLHTQALFWDVFSWLAFWPNIAICPKLTSLPLARPQTHAFLFLFLQCFSSSLIT